jgi:hypothetical protein
MATLAHFSFLTANDNHRDPTSDDARVQYSHSRSAIEKESEDFFVLNTVRRLTIPLMQSYLRLTFFTCVSIAL